MDRQAKKELLQAVRKEIAIEKASIRKAQAQALAAASEAGPTTSADSADGYKNEHIHAGVHLNQLKALTDLETEVVDSNNRPVSKVAEPCYVELMSNTKETTRLFFVVHKALTDSSPILITRRSPIGSAIVNQEVGARISIKTEDGTKRYQITKIA